MNKNKKIAREVSNGVISFLEKNESENLVDMVKDYLDESVNMKVAQVYTPRKLSNSEEIMAKKMLNGLTGDDVTRISFLVDSEMIDGIKILYKDKLWDFSVSSQLDSLKKLYM